MRPDLGPEFLIASETEAASGAESVPLDGVHGVAVDPDSLYGLAEQELGQLHCILLAREYDPDVLRGYEQVYEWSEMHGPWLIRLPDDFVQALAAQSETSTEALARKWADACYAFKANEAPRSWVEKTVARLVRLAQQAARQNKKMYWQVPSC
jgi:hypothetical protein